MGGVESVPPLMSFRGHGGTDAVHPSASIGYVVSHELGHKAAAELKAIAAGGRAEVDIEIQFAIVNGRLVATGGSATSRTVVDEKVAGVAPPAEEEDPYKEEDDPLEKGSKTDSDGHASKAGHLKSVQARSEVASLKQQKKAKEGEAQALEAKITRGESPDPEADRVKLQQVKSEANALSALVQIKESQAKMEETLNTMVTADQRAFGRILNAIVSDGPPKTGRALNIAA